MVERGECGTCTWTIDSDGLLTIAPTSGSEGTLADWGWEDSPFAGKDITAVQFEGTVHAQTCNGMFARCSRLASADLLGLDTSEVTNMGYMFADCSSLSSLDLSNWDTSSMVSMLHMFENCSSLVSLDMSSWDTSQVPLLNWWVFSGCDALERWSIGQGYVFPEISEAPYHLDDVSDRVLAIPSGRWWSTRDSMWFTDGEIATSRLGIADTYTRDSSGTTPPPVVDPPVGDSHDLSDATVSAIADQLYTGSRLEPAVTVKMGDTALIAGTDYNVTYAKNLDAGTATVKIIGTGAYSGTKTVAFNILPADIADAEIAKARNQIYCTFPRQPDTTIKVGTKTLKQGTDYTLSYKDNIEVGTATLIATGKGNYKGTMETTFDIERASISRSRATPALSSTELSEQVYTGSAIEPLRPSLTEFDTLVMLGDVGIAYGDHHRLELQECLASLPCTVLVMRGNHDTRYWRGMILGDLSSGHAETVDRYGTVFMRDSRYPNTLYVSDGGDLAPPIDNTMELWMDEVLEAVDDTVSDWWFGHFHDDRDVARGLGHLLYRRVRKVF